MGSGFPTDGASPFSFFNTVFDAEETILRHAAPDVVPAAGYVTNYLGVRIDPKVAPTMLTDKAGTVEEPPIPANWHADTAEWAAVLRAVELARHGFAMAELGCGWACWINNSGLAARRAGLKLDLVGIEGDPGHLQFAREACLANGIGTDEVSLLRGIAAARSGTALFPKQDVPGGTWALEPVLGSSPQHRTSCLDPAFMTPCR